MRARDFWGKCLLLAWAGAWKWLGILSLPLAMIAAWEVYRHPEWSAQEQAYFNLILIAALPLLACALIFLVRLVLAPYWVHKKFSDSTNTQIQELEAAKWRLEEQQKPQLLVEASRVIDGCVRPCGDNGLVFRLKVTNTGGTPVHGCRGILWRIRKPPAIPWTGDNMTLTFQPSENADSTSKTIFNDAPVFLDVVFVIPWHEGGFELRPGTRGHEWNSNPLFDTVFETFGSGDYVLSIRLVSSDAVTVPVEVAFGWTGNIDTITWGIAPA